MEDNSKLVSSTRGMPKTGGTSHAQVQKSSKDMLEENQIGRNEALVGLGQDVKWLSSMSVLNDLISSDFRSDVPNVHGMFPSKGESATVMRSHIDDFADFDYRQSICQFPSSIEHSQQQQTNIESQVSVTRNENHERLSHDMMHLSNLKHGEIRGSIPNGHHCYSKIAENNFSIQSHTNLNKSVIQTNGYLDKYGLQSHTNLDKPGLPVKSKPNTYTNSDRVKSIYTNNCSNVDVPKLLPPPVLPHSKRRQPTVSMPDKHNATVDFHEINMWNPVNILHHDDNVVNKKPGLSGRSSAPVFMEAGSSRQEHGLSGTSQRNYKHSTNDVDNFTGGSDTTSSQLHQFSRARPQSAATAVFLNNIIYNQIDEGSIQDDSGSHDRRNGFLPSYGSIVISGLDVDQPGSYGSVKSSNSKDAFKTTTSASLLSAAPVSITSYDTQLKTSKWKYVFSHKKTKFHQMPIDDSMEFGTQSSLSQLNQGKANSSKPPDDKNSESKNDEKTINKDENCDDGGRFGDREADAKQETRTAVYHRRWYLLFLFSVSALLWNAIWSTWGPIAQSAKVVYDWSDGDIAMFTWLGNIPFLITMFPSAYLMDVTGMRPAMIVACGFMFLGAGFRCIPSDTGTATWLIRMGQFLNGMAGTIPNSGPALLSALWFPPNQRASATAISTVAGYMGASISFVIGPLLVPEPNYLSPVNGSYEHNQGLDDFDDSNSTSNTTSYQEQKDGIMNILYGECAVAGLLFILVLIYFPSKPPLPPSISASIPREKYLQGLKLLIRNKQFWVCALAFSVPIGVYEAWQVILDVILADQQISQETAGWLDFYATVGGCVSGLLVSKFADFFTRQMKLFLLVFYFFACVAILWFILVVLRIIPFDHVSIYAAIIIAGVFLDGGGPLFFELTIEVSYPVGEGVTSGFTQMLCAAAGIVFLSIVQIQSLGKTWINWCFFGCVAIAIPLLFFINTTYGRADIDDIDVDVPEPDQDDSDNQIQSSSDKNSLLGSSHF